MEKAIGQGKNVDVRRLVFTALMAALSYVLAEFLDFPVPMLIPGFIKFDFSDVPAVLASLTMGPVSGVSVCFIKNALGCITTKTGCVGELSNFILSASLALPAGLLAHKSKSFSRAVVGCSIGAVTMALVSFPSNLFMMYPAYYAVYFHDLPAEAAEGIILGMYQEIIPGMESISQCLLVFNMPFTFVKGAVAAILSLVLYKRLRPIFNNIYREQK